MTGRIKVLLVLVAIVALAGLAAGGAILGQRNALAAPDDPTNNGSAFLGCGGPGAGPMGGMMGVGGMLNGVTADNLAKLLGITTQDLGSQLRQGKSLVEIAQGKTDEQTLVNTILTPHKELMQLKVTQGYLTEEQADQMLSTMEQAVRTMVNSKGQGGTGFGMHGGFGGQGTGMMGGGMMGGYSNGGMMSRFGSN